MPTPKNYNPPTFDEIIDAATEFCLTTGFHMPMAHVIGLNGFGVVVIDMPDTVDERAQVMFDLGMEVSRQAFGQLLDVYLIMEGWMLRGPFIDDGGEMPRPSQSPNRIETLIFFHHNMLNSKMAMVTKRMDRDKAGRLIDLVLMDDTRTDPDAAPPESVLMDAFREGYHRGKANRFPRPSGPRDN